MKSGIEFEDEINLENERVRLEPLRLDHLEALLPIALEHPGLLQFSPSPFGSQENLEKNIQGALSDRSRQFRYPFVIFDKSLNTYVGSTSYGAVSNKDKRLEIGWTWLAPDSQGTDLNLNCKYLLLRYAFEEKGFLRIEFKTDSRNSRSRKALEKIGGFFEGELRSHTVLPDGYRRNTVYYSILKQEWDENKESIFTTILKV